MSCRHTIIISAEDQNKCLMCNAFVKYNTETKKQEAVKPNPGSESVDRMTDHIRERLSKELGGL
jgi:hypothetical protein